MLPLMVIHAEERGKPKNRKRIEWNPIADLPVVSCVGAIEKPGRHALRWQSEVFHKLLELGCKAEKSKLGIGPRLTGPVLGVTLSPEIVGIIESAAGTLPRNPGSEQVPPELSRRGS